MEIYCNGTNGVHLKKEDSDRIMKYLKEKIKEQNISFERSTTSIGYEYPYNTRNTVRITKRDSFGRIREKTNGYVNSYFIDFLFLGRNEENELSIYECSCKAEGYRDVYPYGLTEIVTTDLGMLYDVKVKNLLPPCFCFIKDILSENIDTSNIEIIDKPDSNYPWDFHYIKLRKEPLSKKELAAFEEYKEGIYEWKCIEANYIDEFVEGEGDLFVRLLSTDPEDQIEKTPYILTKAGDTNGAIEDIKNLVKTADKEIKSCYPKYKKYSVIYKDNNILVFKIDDKCYLVNDPEVIKAGIEEHIFSHNCYRLDDDIEKIVPFYYNTEDNNFKKIFYAHDGRTHITRYGDLNAPNDTEQLYRVDVKNNKGFILGAGPLITNPETNKSRRLVYTIKQ